MKHWPALLGTFRPPFLLLTPVCVAPGVATAWHETGALDFSLVLLVLIGALCAHISVNAFNEYLDFRSGLDLNTRRTPFSGGSGTLPANPELAQATWIAAWMSLAFTLLIGVWLFILRGAVLLPIGFLGVAIVLSYTRYITRHPLLCLLAPGTGFGLLMVVGTHVVLTGGHSLNAWLAGLPVFFLVNNLLLLNQFPDREADRAAGRSHLLVRYSPKLGRDVFAGMLALAYASLIMGVRLGSLPAGALLGLLTVPIGVAVLQGLRKHFRDPPGLQPFMGWNVLVNLVTPALIAIGILLSGGA